MSNRIDAVALFSEWEEELEQYTNQSLRASSENSLRETQSRYEQLVSSMHGAENRTGEY